MCYVRQRFVVDLTFDKGSLVEPAQRALSLSSCRAPLFSRKRPGSPSPRKISRSFGRRSLACTASHRLRSTVCPSAFSSCVSVALMLWISADMSSTGASSISRCLHLLIRLPICIIANSMDCSVPQTRLSYAIECSIDVCAMSPIFLWSQATRSEAFPLGGKPRREGRDCVRGYADRVESISSTERAISSARLSTCASISTVSSRYGPPVVTESSAECAACVETPPRASACLDSSSSVCCARRAAMAGGWYVMEENLGRGGGENPWFQLCFLERPEILAGNVFLPAYVAGGCAGTDAPLLFVFGVLPCFWLLVDSGARSRSILDCE